MDDRKQRDQQPNDDKITDQPGLAQADWEGVGSEEVEADAVYQNGEIRYPQPTGELPGEDDDNPYMESDEALPTGKEERALDRDPSRDRDRFDEV